MCLLALFVNSPLLVIRHSLPALTCMLVLMCVCVCLSLSLSPYLSVCVCVFGVQHHWWSHVENPRSWPVRPK